MLLNILRERWASFRNRSYYSYSNISLDLIFVHYFGRVNYERNTGTYTEVALDYQDWGEVSGVKESCIEAPVSVRGELRGNNNKIHTHSCS